MANAENQEHPPEEISTNPFLRRSSNRLLLPTTGLDSNHTTTTQGTEAQVNEELPSPAFPLVVYRSPSLSVAMSRPNSQHSASSQETRVESSTEIRSLPRPAQARGISEVVHPRGRFPLLETSSSSSSSSSRHSSSHCFIRADDDVVAVATLRLLFNVSTGCPPLFNIRGRELDWLQLQSHHLGYTNSLDLATRLVNVPRHPDDSPDPIPVPIPHSHTSVPSVGHDATPSEPAHGVHRTPTPYPGARSNNPAPSSSGSNDTRPDFSPPRGTSLPNLPRLFHEWLTNSVTHAQVINAIDHCPNDRVRSQAMRYIELTEGIREQRDELRQLEEFADESYKLVGAMEWDRCSVATNLMELRAESYLFPYVSPPERPPNPTASQSIPRSTSSSSHSHPRTDPHAPTTSSSSHSNHPTSPPDGSAGIAYTSRMGEHLRVPQPRLHHDQSDNNTSDYHGDRSANTSAQAIRGSTTSVREPSRAFRWTGGGGSKCWRCKSYGHWHRECPGKKHRKSRSRQLTIDKEIDELLASVRTPN